MRAVFFFPWLEADGLGNSFAGRGARSFVAMKAIADRFGPNCFYDSQEPTKAHGEWLLKYGGLDPRRYKEL